MSERLNVVTIVLEIIVAAFAVMSLVTVFVMIRAMQLGFQPGYLTLYFDAGWSIWGSGWLVNRYHIYGAPDSKEPK